MVTLLGPAHCQRRRRLGLGSVGEAVREFGYPVGPVLLAHPAHAFQQAHAARSPEPDPSEASS